MPQQLLNEWTSPLDLMNKKIREAKVHKIDLDSYDECVKHPSPFLKLLEPAYISTLCLVDGLFETHCF